MGDSISVIGFEAIQSIQTESGSVPIFAGRDTAIRCYVKPSIGRDMQAAAALTVAHAGKSIEIPSHNRADLLANNHPDIKSQRRDLDHSFLFLLPGGGVGEGKHELKLSGAVSAQGVALAVAARNNTGSFEAKEGPVLRMRAIGIRMKIPKPDAHLYPPDAGYYLATPRQDDFEAVRQFLHRSFPVSRLEWTQTIIDAPSGFEPPFEDSMLDPAENEMLWASKFSSLAAYLMTIRSEEVDGGENVSALTHYYGIVPDRSFTGAAVNVPETPRPDMIAIGPATGEGELAAHELGHALGGLHLGKVYGGEGQTEADPKYDQTVKGLLSSEAEAAHGMDLGAAREEPRILPYDQYYDLMSYNSPRWPSLNNYMRWLDRLTAESRAPSRADKKGSQYFMAAGVYDLRGDGAGSIDYVRIARHRPAPPPGDGDVRVVALDAEDRVIGVCYVEARHSHASDLAADIAAYSAYIELDDAFPACLALEVRNRRVCKFDLPEMKASAVLDLDETVDTRVIALQRNVFSVVDKGGTDEMGGFELVVEWPDSLLASDRFTIQILDNVWKTVSAAAKPAESIYYLDPFLERGRTYDVRIRRQLTKKPVLVGEIVIPEIASLRESSGFRQAAE